MPVSQLPQAPYRQDRKIFPTPIIGDVLFSEVRDCTRIEIPEYGTPHPNPKKWPDHKLVFVKTVDIERDGIFEFFYAAERENQDLYNFAFGNKIIGNREFRTVTRTYVTLRENFKPVDIEFGTPMPDIPEGKFDGVNYVFYDKEQQNTQQEELNSLFVIEAHSYVEAAVLDEQLSLSVEKQDPLPPKFRVLSPTTTTEELAEGEVTIPTLTGDQLAATEDQINTNLKRKRTTSRSSAENIGSLSGKQVTNVLQVADVVETIVPDGTTITTTALTVDGSVEPLGNGQSLQRVITAPELFAAETYTAQRPDPVPEKFRVLVPTENTEETVEGTAEMPTLIAGEFQASEQQVNVHVKRKSRTKRNITALPKSITQKVTTGEKQVAIITDTLQNGDTAEAPSATKDIQSDALGDGTYVVRKVEVPDLFTAKSITVQRPDPTPDKFRVYLPTITEEENSEGSVTTPTLTTGQIQVSEQQINKFVKRKQITKRDTNTLPKTLIQKATTNEKQVATITEILQSTEPIVQPTATIDVQSDALGDGTFVVRKTEVDEVFPAKSLSVQRPDTVPDKFRAQTEALTRTEREIKTGEVEEPELDGGELERTRQQLTKFTYSEQVTKRDIVGSVALPEVERAYVEGTVAKVNEKLTDDPTIETGLLISESQATAIGDDKYIVQTVKVDSWPELKSSEWDPTLNTQVVRTQQFVSPPTTFNEDNVSYQVVNEDRSLKITEEVPEEALESYLLSVPTRTDIQMPTVLKSAEVIWVKDEAESKGEAEGSGVSPATGGYSIEASSSSNGSYTYSVTPTLKLEYENVFGSDIKATAYFFYTKTSNNSLSEDGLVSRLNALTGLGAQGWPVFKPKAHTVVTQGARLTASAEALAQQSKIKTLYGDEGSTETIKEEGSYSIDRTVDVTTINPTIHAGLAILNAGLYNSIRSTATASARLTGDFDASAFESYYANSSVDVSPKYLEATSPANIPRSGNYIISSKAEPFKWGWVKCSALVVNASQFS